MGWGYDSVFLCPGVKRGAGGGKLPEEFSKTEALPFGERDKARRHTSPGCAGRKDLCSGPSPGCCGLQGDLEAQIATRAPSDPLLRGQGPVTSSRALLPSLHLAEPPAGICSSQSSARKDDPGLRRSCAGRLCRRSPSLWAPPPGSALQGPAQFSLLIPSCACCFGVPPGSFGELPVVAWGLPLSQIGRAHV